MWEIDWPSWIRLQSGQCQLQDSDFYRHPSQCQLSGPETYIHLYQYSCSKHYIPLGGPDQTLSETWVYDLVSDKDWSGLRQSPRTLSGCKLFSISTCTDFVRGSGRVADKVWSGSVRVCLVKFGLYWTREQSDKHKTLTFDKTQPQQIAVMSNLWLHLILHRTIGLTGYVGLF